MRQNTAHPRPPTPHSSTAAVPEASAANFLPAIAHVTHAKTPDVGQSHLHTRVARVVGFAERDIILLILILQGPFWHSLSPTLPVDGTTPGLFLHKTRIQ